MNFGDLDIQTPFYLYNMDNIHARLRTLRIIAKNSPLQILYSIKSASFLSLLQEISPEVDGFAVSSLFESRIAREAINKTGKVHLSTVALLPEQIEELTSICDYVNINSINQWRRFSRLLDGKVECGLRINPMTNYVADPRFDPCRKHSKLGVPLVDLQSLYTKEPEVLDGINGLQFHNNCESKDFQQLVETCKLLVSSCGQFSEKINWVNIGGGYLFNERDDMHGLAEAVRLLNSASFNQIYFEPGKAIVGDTGYLISSVVDLFTSSGKDIAILDCSVNHLPEIFEFQYQPKILSHSSHGKFRYRLAGLTCLSGDLFGDYRFRKPLQLGDRIVFKDVGAYMYVKANMFNGINIPSAYLFEEASGTTLMKKHSFDDFLHWQK